MREAMLRLCLIVICLPFCLAIFGQQVVPLYPNSIPNARPYTMKEDSLLWNGSFGGFRNVSIPSLELYLPAPEKASGEAVIICPGGGYMVEAYRDEGIAIARYFASRGIAGIILKYRLPSDSIMVDKTIGPLQDAQQAIKTVREQAATWHIKADKIGVMGFSAGGHLAATAGTHFNKAYIPNPGGTSLRPDFMILVYPVISMQDDLTHAGSRSFLLGEKPSADKKVFFSNERQVTKNTPRTWLTHTGDDSVVTVKNSLVFYEALQQNGIEAEMHVYPRGDHGFVLAFPAEKWMARLVDWIRKADPFTSKPWEK
ncbi:MAG: alpha/beta hydrolase [Bacteroidetes bacterium]|nr:alpha/beta hydrolase [Bacteroidota bacterium]